MIVPCQTRSNLSWFDLLNPQTWVWGSLNLRFLTLIHSNSRHVNQVWMMLLAKTWRRMKMRMRICSLTSRTCISKVKHAIASKQLWQHLPTRCSWLFLLGRGRKHVRTNRKNYEKVVSQKKDALARSQVTTSLARLSMIRRQTFTSHRLALQSFLLTSSRDEQLLIEHQLTSEVITSEVDFWG